MQGCALLFLLSACDGRNPFRDAEQRITDAFPVSEAVLKTKARVEGFSADGAGAELFAEEYETRLKLRALSCAGGNSPSFLASTRAIRESLSADCFVKADEELRGWLQVKVLRYLLAAPPLRPLPATPPAMISASHHSIGTLRFASQAGIAISASGSTVEIIDTGTDESLYEDTKSEDYGRDATLSPNGRVFVVAPARNGVRLRESETGEVLATWPEHSQFFFLDSLTAVMVRRDGQGLDLLDLETSRTEAVKGVGGAGSVLPVPGVPGEFLLAGYGNQVSRMRLQRDASGTRLSLVDQQRGPRGSWSGRAGGASFDGRFFYHLEQRNEVWRTDLATLQSERLPIDGLQVTGVTPLPDADRLLLRISLPAAGGNRLFVVYSISGQNYAPVEEGELAAGDSVSVEPVAVPALGRLGLISGKSVRLVSEVKAGPSYSGQAFGLYVAERAQELATKLATLRGGMREGGSSGYRPSPLDASLVAAAANARIEVIGIYEPESRYKGTGPRAGADSRSSYISSPVTVIVRPSDKPIMLVLASYEAASWRLVVTPGAQLKAVLLSGYETSTVDGMGSARVVNIGRSYAYERGGSSYSQLLHDIQATTGRTADGFQGKYRGLSFMVGGR